MTKTCSPMTVAERLNKCSEILKNKMGTLEYDRLSLEINYPKDDKRTLAASKHACEEKEYLKKFKALATIFKDDAGFGNILDEVWRIPYYQVKGGLSRTSMMKNTISSYSEDFNPQDKTSLNIEAFLTLSEVHVEWILEYLYHLRLGNMPTLRFGLR